MSDKRTIDAYWVMEQRQRLAGAERVSFPRAIAEEIFDALDKNWDASIANWMPMHMAPKNKWIPVWGRWHSGDDRKCLSLVFWSSSKTAWLDPRGNRFVPTHFLDVAPPPQKETSDE